MRNSARVVGDISVDWFLSLADQPRAPNMQVSYAWEHAASPAMSGNPGGAALIRTLADAVLQQREGCDCRVSGSDLPEQALAEPGWPYVVRSYSFWRRVPREAPPRDQVWRMERFVGWHPAQQDDPGFRLVPEGREVTCLFVEDGNQRFREDPANWGPSTDLDAQHVVVRQTGNLGKGELWDSLTDRFGDRLSLICAVSDLRREGAPIGKPLSWERTAQDVVDAIQTRPHLRKASRVIVVLATSGAVIVEQGRPSTVLFDPFNQEGDWERSRLGISYGAGSCAVASVVDELTHNAGDPNLPDAVRRGLLAARAMFDGGYEATITGGGWKIAFPIQRVARVIANQDEQENPMQVAEVDPAPGWRLFESAYSGSFRDAAQQIALKGERAAGREIPIERMGAWASVDRIEIESMRSVRNIINEYLSTPRKSRPLSLAVFGPPGSGKSFAIKQMAKVTTSAGPPISVLEFNLSQFHSIDELPAALQRVRDQAVTQSLPLVFWDEFDSAIDGRELGWLVNFLAPMQDGQFIENGNVRPIGPAIFVFAGGTHSTMDSFRARAMELPSSKATDFLSRLRGYVNILGPNPDGPDDQTYSLRRAMLLRAVLSGRAPQVFDGDELRIDEGILRAFLDAPLYFHGSRSMESIIEMSALSGALKYELSALPAVHQIALHVDSAEFMKLVEE